MSALVLAGVGLLGGAGAIARLLLDGAVSARAWTAFWSLLRTHTPSKRRGSTPAP